MQKEKNPGYCEKRGISGSLCYIHVAQYYVVAFVIVSFGNLAGIYPHLLEQCFFPLPAERSTFKEIQSCDT